MPFLAFLAFKPCNQAASTGGRLPAINGRNGNSWRPLAFKTAIRKPAAGGYLSARNGRNGKKHTYSYCHFFGARIAAVPEAGAAWSGREADPSLRSWIRAGGFRMKPARRLLTVGEVAEVPGRSEPPMPGSSRREKLAGAHCHRRKPPTRRQLWNVTDLAGWECRRAGFMTELDATVRTESRTSKWASICASIPSLRLSRNGCKATRSSDRWVQRPTINSTISGD